MKENILLTIVLPTYNEEENIQPILIEIRKALVGFTNSYEILFVDDSNDGTADLIAQQQQQYAEIRLLHRPAHERTGLATALVLGMQSAEGQYICCLDSDLQHPPETIIALVNKIIAAKADIAIASRYLPGGSAEGLGGPYRRYASHICRFSAWAILPSVRKSTDPGSGFYVVTKDYIKNIHFEELYGYKVLIDMLARSPHATVVEEPYTFLPRENEVSKSTLKQGLLFYKHIGLLFRDNVLRKNDDQFVTNE